MKLLVIITKKLFIEISKLGFHSNDMKPFIKVCKDLKKVTQIKC